MTTIEILSEFHRFYQRPADGVSQAPGRVNLIGEHTDYNGGFVLPIAIEKNTQAAFASRTDRIVRLASLQAAGQAVEVPLDKSVQLGEPKWGNYCKGVIAELFKAGIELCGADILISSDVPLGGGLSSSASLEVALAMALLELAGRAGSLPPNKLALLCQRAENLYAMAPCGIMDQSIAAMARPGHALLMDCRSGQTQQIPFDDPRVVLLVADTQVKHAIGDGGYGARRRQCAEAAEILGLSSLRDATPQMLAKAQADRLLDDKQLMRARHVIGEIQRTQQAVEALQAGRYDEFGQLMYQSHKSLAKDFEVSCVELDCIVELASQLPGVYGARMTGGGFGGCAIVLAQAGQSQGIADAVAGGFALRFGRRCPIFATRAATGASAERIGR